MSGAECDDSMTERGSRRSNPGRNAARVTRKLQIVYLRGASARRPEDPPGLGPRGEPPCARPPRPPKPPRQPPAGPGSTRQPRADLEHPLPGAHPCPFCDPPQDGRIGEEVLPEALLRPKVRRAGDPIGPGRPAALLRAAGAGALGAHGSQPRGQVGTALMSRPARTPGENRCRPAAATIAALSVQVSGRGMASESPCAALPPRTAPEAGVLHATPPTPPRVAHPSGPRPERLQHQGVDHGLLERSAGVPEVPVAKRLPVPLAVGADRGLQAGEREIQVPVWTIGLGNANRSRPPSRASRSIRAPPG